MNSYSIKHNNWLMPYEINLRWSNGNYFILNKQCLHMSPYPLRFDSLIMDLKNFESSPFLQAVLVGLPFISCSLSISTQKHWICMILISNSEQNGTWFYLYDSKMLLSYTLVNWHSYRKWPNWQLIYLLMVIFHSKM